MKPGVKPGDDSYSAVFVRPIVRLAIKWECALNAAVVAASPGKLLDSVKT